ncbi:gliding motility lipoprotein GldD [Sphingobacterium bovistauri]|uniref:Gliding motility lipoprotein GldD n=1 Tax=Sphingobacterium bovistauri TaxID=2781959 RepID=A0ABS7Z8L4_9SPHI|nr:gliding motility lipoprotein GldD [Sphingobacterium bovistauri]MCA5005897.1 gliding motility lipoprotein GldD [Sphingobacterium bovistauri]
MLRFLGYIFVFIALLSCSNEDYSPKPRGYHRIIFPAKEYIHYKDEKYPYSFEVPKYSRLVDENNSQPYWKNLDFPHFNARLHLSYFNITKQATLQALTEDARSFAFKHTPKASAIDQQAIKYPHNNVYGLIYNIQGNTASNFQFYATDNNKHYIRGALYFNEKPNLDSIQPVLDFIKSDIQHLITTIRWK